MNDNKALNQILTEYEDLYAAYAEICNAHLDEELAAIKSHLEQEFAYRLMEEYGWELTAEGKWRYVTMKEYCRRMRMRNKKHRKGK